MKRITIFVVLIIAMLSVSIAAAQEPENPEGRQGHPKGRRIVMEIILEATGLEREELREAMQDEDATLASVIEANGGDVDAVTAQIIAAISENSDKDAAEIEAKVDELLNTPKSERPERQGDGEGRRGRGPRGDNPPADSPDAENTNA